MCLVGKNPQMRKEFTYEVSVRIPSVAHNGQILLSNTLLLEREAVVLNLPYAEIL